MKAHFNTEKMFCKRNGLSFSKELGSIRWAVA